MLFAQRGPVREGVSRRRVVGGKGGGGEGRTEVIQAKVSAAWTRERNQGENQGWSAISKRCMRGTRGAIVVVFSGNNLFLDVFLLGDF